MEEVEKDETIKVVIITGAGKGFSAGADVKSRLAKQLEEVPLEETPIGRYFLSFSS